MLILFSLNDIPVIQHCLSYLLWNFLFCIFVNIPENSGFSMRSLAFPEKIYFPIECPACIFRKLLEFPYKTQIFHKGFVNDRLFYASFWPIFTNVTLLQLGFSSNENVDIKFTVYNRTVFKNGSCCIVRPGKVSCLQRFRHFWMIMRDLFFFESGSTEVTKI